MIRKRLGDNMKPIHNLIMVLTIIFVFLVNTSYVVYAGSNNPDSVHFRQLLTSAKKHANNLNLALLELDTALQIAKKQNNKKEIAAVFIERGTILQQNNLLGQADTSLIKARSILSPYEKSKNYLFLLKKLAIVNYYLGNNKVILKYTLEGLNLAKDMKDTLLQGTFNNISGIAMDAMGNKPLALEYYLNALKVFELLGDKEKIASVETNIAIIYQDLGFLQKAESGYQKVLKTAIEIHDTTLLSASYNNLSNIYASRDEYKKALQYIKMSLALSRKQKDWYAVANCLNNVGDIYFHLKEWDSSFRYYQSAFNMAKKISDKRTMALSLLNLADYYKHKNQTTTAGKYAQKSLMLMKNGKGNVLDKIAAMKLLTDLYALQNQYKKAYSLIKNYTELKDSLYQKEKENQINAIETRAEMLKKNKIIQLEKEKRKRVEAYFIIAILLALFVIMLLIFWIQRRKYKTRELSRQKFFLDTLLEESEGHVVVTDENGNSTYLSSSYLKSFGRVNKERLGHSIFDFIHPDDLPELLKAMESLKKNTVVKKNIFFRLKNSKGEYRVMRGTAKKIENHPDLKGYIINFWDVTETQEAEKALRESEEKYRNIFNAFPDIYFRVNNKGIISEISPSVTKITGYLPQEVIGKPVGSFIHSVVGWEKAQTLFFKLRKLTDYNIDLIGKDNRRIHCSMNGRVVKLNNGEHAGFEGTLRDITQRVEAERKLHQSEQRLIEANDTKDKLLSIISHDLRGSVGTQKEILSMVTEEIDSFSKDEILLLIKTIKNSVDSTYAMIDNLLSWARLMRDKIEPVRKSSELFPIISSVFEYLKKQAEDKQIKLFFEGNKKVKGFFDPNLMEIILRNLIVNAIKFSYPGNDIKVIVNEDVNKIKISVEDKGVGMTNEDIQKIFSQSGRIESKPGTNREKGTGLGLIIVREFIALNKGELSIESEKGKGTRFTFTVPVQENNK